MPEHTLPKHAQVVVVGGGIVGCATAYHLGKHGVSDVVVLEQETLTSGTTWHAAGVVGSLRPSIFLTHLTVAACKLLPELEIETGQSTGYRRTGGLSIAQTPERFEELKRVPAIGAITGFEGQLLTPAEIREKSPVLNVSDLVGGVWIPMDGQTNPTDTTMAFAKGAKNRGAKIYEHTRVTGFKSCPRRLKTVVSEQGEITCEYVVLCAGMWTRHLANQLDTAVPLQAVEHMYIVTEPMADVPIDQPFIRDFDSSFYIKGDAGKLLVGSVDIVSKPWAVDGIPSDSAFTQFPEDWEQFEPYMASALRRVPALEHTGIRQFLNGPESFTVDTRHMLGRAPGYDNLFVAAGFNTTGIMSSAGAGSLIAQWIVDGHEPMDTWEVDPRRFEQWASTDRFIRDRSIESPGLAFAMHWPYRQPETARGVKHSNLHHRLAEAGACFGVVAGWERPMWYAPRREEAHFDYSFSAQSWWKHARREALAVSESVALFDQSQLAVFEIHGQDALTALQRLCANNLDVAMGRVVYTQMLNEQGGIEADVTVARLGENVFRIMTGAPNRVRDLDWVERGLKNTDCVCFDKTSDFAVVSLMGPQSRALLQTVSDSSLDDEAIPFATLASIHIGYAAAAAQRISYVGELGYELFIKTEFVNHVYDTLVAAGTTFQLRHGGLLCMDSCRIEKAYRHWGHELSPSITPLEAGLGFAVDFSKPFVGQDALQKQKREGVLQHIMLFALADGDPLLLHDEPIYRDGVLAGETTSGSQAFRVGGSLAFGLIHHELGETNSSLRASSYEIEVAGVRYPAQALSKAPYDPGGLKMRSET